MAVSKATEVTETHALESVSTEHFTWKYTLFSPDHEQAWTWTLCVNNLQMDIGTQQVLSFFHKSWSIVWASFLCKIKVLQLF